MRRYLVRRLGLLPPTPASGARPTALDPSAHDQGISVVAAPRFPWSISATSRPRTPSRHQRQPELSASNGTLIGSLLISALDSALGSEAMCDAWAGASVLCSAVLGRARPGAALARLEDAAEPLPVPGDAVFVAFATVARHAGGDLGRHPLGSGLLRLLHLLVTFAQQDHALRGGGSEHWSGDRRAADDAVRHTLATALSDRVGRRPVMLAGVIRDCCWRGPCSPSRPAIVPGSCVASRSCSPWRSRW